MLLLFFIFVAELAEARFVLEIPNILPTNATPALFLLYFFQFLCAPIQGGISDYYCRKKSLTFAFIAIAIAELLLYFSSHIENMYLYTSIIIYAALGNVDVLARAALLDQNFGKSRRISMGASFIAQALAWIVMAFFIKLYTLFHVRISLSNIGLTIIATYLSLYFFKDIRDLPERKAPFSLLKEIKNIITLSCNKKVNVIFLAYLCTQIAFFISFIFQDLFFERAIEWQYIMYYSVGFALGLFFQMIINLDNRQGVLWGTALAMLAIILGWLFNSLDLKKAWPEFGFDFFLFSFGVGIILPCVYASTSEGHTLHQEGKIFGVLSSIQTLGEIAASILLIYWVSPKALSIQAAVALFFMLAFMLFMKGFHFPQIKKR